MPLGIMPAFADAAVQDPVVDRSLKIVKISEGVYLHTSYKELDDYGWFDSNGVVVVQGRDAYIIDTPWSEQDTHALLRWIDGKGYKVAAGVATHSHDDRTAGIAVLNAKDIPTYTSELTRDFLVRDGKPTPSRTFKGDKFTLADGVAELYYPGPGHTEDNIVVWLPESKILVGGCLLRAHDWNHLGYTGEAVIPSWAESIRNIQAQGYDIQTVVPGHGVLGPADMLDHTAEIAEIAARSAGK